MPGHLPIQALQLMLPPPHLTLPAAAQVVLDLLWCAGDSVLGHLTLASSCFKPMSSRSYR